MTDLRVERLFPVSPDRLYAAVSEPEQLLQWWGPEEYVLQETQLDLTRLGPWFAKLSAPDGHSVKMSGQVTRVDPPKQIGFTWGWHDPDDVRGAESHVMFTVAETETGSRLIVDHRDLADAEVGEGHTRGWNSTLNRLENYLK